jgi:signal peptidase I
MFGIFDRERRKMRHNAKNWLQLAKKVCNFRRDQLTEPELAALKQGVADLEERLKRNEDPSKLKFSIERLEGQLRRTGGAYYPKSSTVENVEFFLVAAIVFLGIRAFFIQPFKIPTNSMWPSYYGMTAEVYQQPEEAPGAIARGFRLLAFGATRRQAEAPIDGEVRLPVLIDGSGRAVLPRSQVSARRWFVLPGVAQEFTLLVGNQPVTVRVPVDFQFEPVLEEAFFGGRPLEQAVREQVAAGRAVESFMELRNGTQRGTVRALLVSTGRQVRKGEKAIAFDVMTGDQLFVDRMSYHFVRPSVGQGFVFRTGNIPGLGRPGPGGEMIPDDKYYIKRLAGGPGDRLEIQPPAVLRNGQPIDGAAAFDKNNRRVGKYTGYVPMGNLQPGQELVVPEDSYYALGDNSRNSYDSRGWGFVPGEDVVGRPLFIYYPFTRRFGPAR